MAPSFIVCDYMQFQTQGKIAFLANFHLLGLLQCSVITANHQTHLASPQLCVQGVEATPFFLIIDAILPPTQTASKSRNKE